MNDLKKEISSIVTKHAKEQKDSMKEFSKVMIKRYSISCILWITASYFLAAFDKQVNEAVTITVITSLAVVLLGYFMKTMKENINKHK